MWVLCVVVRLRAGLCGCFRVCVRVCGEWGRVCACLCDVSLCVHAFGCVCVCVCVYVCVCSIYAVLSAQTMHFADIMVEV